MSCRQTRESESRTTTTSQSRGMRNDAASAAAMRPKSGRQQGAQRATSRQSTTERKYGGRQGAHSQVSMSTEYQESFLPPCCRHTFMSLSVKSPKHRLNWDNDVEANVRSFCVTHKLMQNPTHDPSEPPKDRRGHNNTPHNSGNVGVDNMNYSTAYSRDFQIWPVNRRLPLKLKDNLNVREGLALKGTTSLSKPVSGRSKLQPMESLTTYTAAFVPHQVKSRPCRRKKPTNQTGHGLASEPAVSSNPTAAMHSNQEPPGVVHQLKVWSVETKGSGLPAEQGLHQNSPADDKPILLSVQISEGLNEAPQLMSTLKEDCEVWDAPQRSKPADGQGNKPRSASLRLRFSAPSPNTVEVFSGFQCSTENGHTRKMSWSGSVDRDGPPQGPAAQLEAEP